MKGIIVTSIIAVSTRSRLAPFLVPMVVALVIVGFFLAGTGSAAATGFTVYAPWDSGKTFAVGNPPNSGVGGGYYGHCCGGTPNLDYYAVDINGPGGGNADCGENVRATRSGTVSAVGAYSPSGISYLRIDHGGGYTSEYQHITNRVPTGTPVSRGDVIAKFGNVGTVYCHLHFVVKFNGGSVAPSPMSGVPLPTSGGAYVLSNNSPPSSAWGGVGSATFFGSDTLASGQELAANKYLLSIDAHQALILQLDGNLVLYSGNATWQSNTSGSGANRLAMQTDGNLVLYNGSTPVWYSGTGGTGPGHATVQGDGNFVVYKDATGSATWQSGTSGALTSTYSGAANLSAGQELSTQHYLRSADKSYALLMQSDSNLVLHGPGYHVLWHTNSNGSGANRLAMQTDGNLVLYNGSTPVWYSGTGGTGPGHATVQGDGNFVVYNDASGSAVWQAGTSGQT